MNPAKNPAAVALGRLGGKAGTGQAKARSPEQARAAALKRWAKAERQLPEKSAALGNSRASR